MIMFSGKGNWVQRKKIRDFGYMLAKFSHYVQGSFCVILMFLPGLKL